MPSIPGAAVERPSTAAAAPSPKRIAVPRSSGSVIRLIVSDTDDRARARIPRSRAKRRRRARTRNPRTRRRDRTSRSAARACRRCTRRCAASAVSGDAVATTRRSMSVGDSPARLIASAAAAVPSVDDVSPGAAIRRSRMPVRSTIHSSLVSRVASRSAFVRRPSGTAVPQPSTETGRPFTRRATTRSVDRSGAARRGAPACPSACRRRG